MGIRCPLALRQLCRFDGSWPARAVLCRGGAHPRPTSRWLPSAKGRGAHSAFASLRSDESMSGPAPGARYPVDWVFKTQGHAGRNASQNTRIGQNPRLQGASGWVHQSLLTRQAQLLLFRQRRPACIKPGNFGRSGAKLEPEVMGKSAPAPGLVPGEGFRGQRLESAPACGASINPSRLLAAAAAGS